MKTHPLLLVAAFLTVLASPGLAADFTAVAVGAQEALQRGSLSPVPAERWEDAFITGNGRLGAMIFGNPTNDTIVASHCRLFLPLGNREIVPDLAAHVPELRRIIREKGCGEARKFFLGKAGFRDPLLTLI